MTSDDYIGDPRGLLGLPPTSEQLLEFLNTVGRQQNSSSGNETCVPEVKAYPDAIYLNYYTLGLSLMFVSHDGSKNVKKEDVNGDKLVLDSIDIYNPSLRSVDTKAEEISTSTTYRKYPVAEISLSLVSLRDGKERAKEVKITPASSGKDLVAILGEPNRKGGGGGPSKGSIDIWCEWTADGIMIEFGGEEAKGPKAWETGKDARWKVLTLFRPPEDK